MLDTTSHLTEDQLSAHLDGQLPETETVLAATHLDACVTCRSAFSELQSTVGLLRALPELRPPRSFQVGAPPASVWSRLMQWDLGVRGLAAAAAALFVVMVSGDLHLLTSTSAPGALPAPTALSGAVAPRSAAAPARFSLTPSPVPTSGPAITAATPPAAAPPAPAQPAAAPPAAESARSQPAGDTAQIRAAESKATKDAATSASDPLGSIRSGTVLAGVSALGLGALAIVRARRRI